MKDKISPKLPLQASETKDIFMAYYSRAVNELGQDKAAGESRFNFYLAIITSASGALVVLFQLGATSTLAIPISLVVLGTLIAYGVLTHSRMICRQLDLTRKRLQLYWVEQYYVERNNELERYLFDRFAPPEHAKLITLRQALFGSGLRMTVAVINSILSGVFGYIFVALLLEQSLFLSLATSLVFIIVSYTWQSLDYKRQATKKYQHWQRHK